MNRRRPTTAGTDQLSLNLSVTRSSGGSVLASILLWLLGTLRGGVTAAVSSVLQGIWRPPGVWPNVEAQL